MSRIPMTLPHKRIENTFDPHSLAREISMLTSFPIKNKLS